MKKLLIVALLVVSPLFVSAQTVDSQAGLEFLTPLVQTIIQLLHDRIADLSAEVLALKVSLASVPTCVPLGATPPVNTTPSQPTAPVIIPVMEQTVLVSVVNTPNDPCPSFQFTSDRPFTVEEVAFDSSSVMASYACMNGRATCQSSAEGVNKVRLPDVKDVRSFKLRACMTGNGTLDKGNTVVTSNGVRLEVK